MYVRVAVFFAVLVLMSGLLIGLFHEARAVTPNWVSPPASITGTTAFTVEFLVPQGQRIPITGLQVVLEKQHSSMSGSGLDGKLRATSESVVECRSMQLTPNNGCTSSLVTVSGSANLVTEIKFTEFLRKQSATSTGYTIATADAYNVGTLTWTASGYGYDDASTNYNNLGYGYGYGFNRGGATYTYDLGTGVGYGYAGDDMRIRFQVSVAGAQLSVNSRYFLTASALTGQGFVPLIMSPFTDFTIAAAGGGGGGGGGTPGETIITCSVATCSGTAGTDGKITFIFNSVTGFVTIKVTITTTAGNTITMTVQALSAAPAGTPTLFGGTTLYSYLEMSAVGMKAGDTATVEFNISPTQMGSNTPSQLALLHVVNGVWQAETLTYAGLVGGNHQYKVTLTSFSVFALAFDTQKPTITLTVPTGTVKGTITASANAADNVKVAKVEFFVDGTSKGSDTSSPYELSLDTTTLTNGKHAVKAVATDIVGNTAEDSKDVTVENAGGTPTPTTKAKGKISPIVWVILILVVIALIVAAVVLAGKKPKP